MTLSQHRASVDKAIRVVTQEARHLETSVQKLETFLKRLRKRKTIVEAPSLNQARVLLANVNAQYMKTQKALTDTVTIASQF